MTYDEADPVRINVTGEISPALARTVRAQLREAHGRPVEVVINSSGGSYAAGVEIFNALRGHVGGVTTLVTGYAASAASLVAMGGEKRIMTPTAKLMIHDVAVDDIGGPAHRLARAAVAVTSMANDLAEVYAFRAGGTVEHWRDLMIRESTFSAIEAVENGLMDSIDWDYRPTAAGPVRAGGNPREIWYTPRDSRPRFGLSLFGNGAAASVSVFDPRWRADRVRGRVMASVLDAQAKQRQESRRTARWVAWCLVHELGRTPLGRSVLASAARAANR